MNKDYGTYHLTLMGPYDPSSFIYLVTASQLLKVTKQFRLGRMFTATSILLLILEVTNISPSKDTHRIPQQNRFCYMFIILQVIQMRQNFKVHTVFKLGNCHFPLKYQPSWLFIWILQSCIPAFFFHYLPSQRYWEWQRWDSQIPPAAHLARSNMM